MSSEEKKENEDEDEEVEEGWIGPLPLPKTESTGMTSNHEGSQFLDLVSEGYRFYLSIRLSVMSLTCTE